MFKDVSELRDYATSLRDRGQGILAEVVEHIAEVLENKFSPQKEDADTNKEET